jgi:response regulator receiver domain-containing protein
MRRAGHQVLEAADGEQALQAARAEQPPSLVLLDIRMPRLDGLGVLRALRARPRPGMRRGSTPPNEPSPTLIPLSGTRQSGKPPRSSRRPTARSRVPDWHWEPSPMTCSTGCYLPQKTPAPPIP